MSKSASLARESFAAEAADLPRDPGKPNPWLFVQSRWQPETAARDETLFALANGAFGVRGGMEESSSPSQGCFIANVWERTPIAYHERHFGFALHSDTRVPVADATALRIRCNGESVDPAAGECLAFERVLDLHSGCLARSTTWRSAQGVVFQVTAQRIVCLQQPGLACLRWTLCLPHDSASIDIDSCIFGKRAAAAQGSDPRFGAGSGLAMDVTQAAADADGAWLAQRTPTSGIGVVCAQRHRVTGANFAHARADADSVIQTFAAILAPEDSITIEKYIAYAWTQPHAADSEARLRERADATLDAALATGADALFERQRRDCDAFWSVAHIAIDSGEAGLRDEQALRFNLFHLFQSAGRDGSNGVSAKGLTGEGYEGHVFWDSEVFILPVYAFTAPALMKPHLVWRYRCLDRALTHAHEMNLAHGALYPWRTIAGDECSSHYPSGSAQYHINAAIAYAIRLYVEASGDRAFLAEMGAEMLAQTARIWLEIGHFNPRRGNAFCIDAVTGPDEYTALVDNNYYTNRMAQEHLRYAAATLRGLANADAATYAALARRIGLSDGEIATWLRAADAMYLPRDERLGIIAQDDTFLDKAMWDFAGTPPDKYPLLIHHHPLTLYRYQVCKQADAILALVLAGDGIDRATKRRSFDYYEAITTHDSTLSASTFAILAAEVGHTEKAQGYFRDTLRVDLDDLHGNAGHGAHLAAMAGSWLALTWGFAGLRVRHASDGEVRLCFDPMLPPAWNGYCFGLVWQGRRLTVSVADGNVRYTLDAGAPLSIMHADERLSLEQGKPLARPARNRGAPTLLPKLAFPRPLQALIFDLDGVIADTAHLHQAAWQRLAGEIGLPWDDAIGDKLKGVDRATSLEIMLGASSGKYTNVQKRELAERKNGYYRAAIATYSAANLLPGARAALLAARAAGLKTALASASRSAHELAERLGIAGLFDHIVDAATVAHPKPHPEIFQRAAAVLGVTPAVCLGIEDAQAGIAAIKAAGMAALGIGDARLLQEADAVLPDLRSFELEKFVLHMESP